MSDVDEAAAILAALNAALDSGPMPRKAYELDKIDKDHPPAEYTEFSLTRRYGNGAKRAGSGPGTTQRRILTRYVAGSVNNARNMRAKVTAALENVSINVGSTSTSPIEFETDETIGPDDGKFSGFDTWTYSI